MAVQRHIPAALSDFVIKLVQDPSNYNVSNIIAPTKSVSKDTDQYYIYDTSQSFRRGDTKRANRTAAKRVDLQDMSTGTYVLKYKGLANQVSDRDRQSADDAVNPEMDAVEFVMDQMLLDKEWEAAEIFFTTTATSNNTTLTTNQWDFDTTTSNPIDDCDTAINTIIKSIGKRPTYGVMGFPTFQVVKDHPEILDRIKWSERGFITQDLLSAALGIPNLTVSQAIGQTLPEGISATTDFLFNKKMLIFYNDPNPGLYNSNFGTCFTGMYGDARPQVSQWREESTKSDIYEVNWAYHQKVVLSLAGYIIASTNS